MEQFKAKFGPNYDMEILKNHYRALKKNHSAIKTLIDQSGFGWDNDREMVYADDDQVWNDYVKAHPDFGIWRTKSITGYEDLCIIFGDGGASGKHSRAPSEKVKNHGKHIPKDAGNMIGENLNGESSQSPLVGSNYLGKEFFLLEADSPSVWKERHHNYRRGRGRPPTTYSQGAGGPLCTQNTSPHRRNVPGGSTSHPYRSVVCTTAHVVESVGFTAGQGGPLLSATTVETGHVEGSTTLHQIGTQNAPHKGGVNQEGYTSSSHLDGAGNASVQNMISNTNQDATTLPTAQGCSGSTSLHQFTTGDATNNNTSQRDHNYGRGRGRPPTNNNTSQRDHNYGRGCGKPPRPPTTYSQGVGEPLRTQNTSRPRRNEPRGRSRSHPYSSVDLTTVHILESGGFTAGQGGPLLYFTTVETGNVEGSTTLPQIGTQNAQHKGGVNQEGYTSSSHLNRAGNALGQGGPLLSTNTDLPFSCILIFVYSKSSFIYDAGSTILHHYRMPNAPHQGGVNQVGNTRSSRSGERGNASIQYMSSNTKILLNEDKGQTLIPRFGGLRDGPGIPRLNATTLATYYPTGVLRFDLVQMPVGAQQQNSGPDIDALSRHFVIEDSQQDVGQQWNDLVVTCAISDGVAWGQEDVIRDCGHYYNLCCNSVCSHLHCTICSGSATNLQSYAPPPVPAANVQVYAPPPIHAANVQVYAPPPIPAANVQAYTPPAISAENLSYLVVRCAICDGVAWGQEDVIRDCGHYNNLRCNSVCSYLHCTICSGSAANLQSYAPPPVPAENVQVYAPRPIPAANVQAYTPPAISAENLSYPPPSCDMCKVPVWGHDYQLFICGHIFHPCCITTNCGDIPHCPCGNWTDYGNPQ
ncbi:hypothetical protein IFM89_005087 [Coptis chinensis]|uniref:Myb/SANT-like domain-containing protein n=1 Tax=Coptis chinensis TaxID=261450 RepID=A0A835M492_9MAGN|nr:hypothetical protein IFM89_005087 [Coptis chinensis]